MKTLLVLPLIVPLCTAIAILLVGSRRRLQRGLGVLGSAVHLAVAVRLFLGVWDSGIATVQLGGWPAPFGISFVADTLSTLMVLLAALMGLAVAIYSLADVDPKRESFGYHALFQVLLMGVCGSFLTGDLFNLFVWFEVMLMASFVLLALGSERAQLEGALKYVTLNLVASALFLAAVGLTYGVAGTLNMADLSVRLANAPDQGFVLVLAMLFMICFGLKAAVFPLFAWLPASYHTPPVSVSAIFAGLLTKVGVYALIRVFTLLFTQETALTHGLLLVTACITMVTGVLGAAAQNEVRRILSFHIVSQIGYMVLGLALFTPLALAGSVFYLAHHIVVKTNLFLVAGIIRKLKGSANLKRIGGLYASHPLLALVFLVPALSLAGIPPLSGFWAKLMLLQASLRAEEYLVAAITLFVGLLTLYSMTKIWNEAFWKIQPEPSSTPFVAGPPPTRWEMFALVFPVVSLALVTVGLGLFGELLVQVADRAATELLDKSHYVDAVMSGRGR